MIAVNKEIRPLNSGRRMCNREGIINRFLADPGNFGRVSILLLNLLLMLVFLQRSAGTAGSYGVLRPLEDDTWLKHYSNLLLEANHAVGVPIYESAFNH